MVLHVLRVVFILVVLALTLSYAYDEDVYSGGMLYVQLYIIIPVVLAFLVVCFDIFWRRKPLRALSGLFFGLLAGVVLAAAANTILWMLGEVFPQIQAREVKLATALMDVAIVFFCVTVVMQTKDDFRFIVPYVEFTRTTRGARPLLLDTSVIIDGRVVDIAKTGIFEGDLVVTRFVLDEVQTIADSADKLRRNRGRHGLDVLNRLKASDQVEVQIFDGDVSEVAQSDEVDAKLVALAKHLEAVIVTNDYNLNKVAQLRGVSVLNINDLANALKPIVQAGEEMSVEVIKPGEQPGQGIGYLDDGTMVVVEQGREHIGRRVSIAVTSILQTSAGRMIFGRVSDETQNG